MAKVSDLSKPENLKILIYGESGNGKTYSISTFPSPVFVFDFDRGIETLSGLVGDGFDYEQYFDPNPRIPKAYTKFREHIADLRKSCPYETIVIDSLTFLGEKIIPNHIRAGTGHVDTPLERQDHLKISDRLTQILDEILGIDANVVMLSHPRVIQVEETGEIKYLPMLTGTKLPQKAPLYFDELYKAEKKASKEKGEFDFIWQTRSDRRWPARSRFNYINSDGNKRPILDAQEPQDLSRILEKVTKTRKLK